MHVLYESSHLFSLEAFHHNRQVIRATFPRNLSRNIVALQVARLCCPYYHPRKQLVKHQDLLPKVEPSSTSCNMLLQLATLKSVARQIACGGGNTGNKTLQHCCATSCTKMLTVLLGLNRERKITTSRACQFQSALIKIS